MRYRQKEKLRDLLEQGLRRLSDAKLESKSQVTQEELNALHRLARALEISGIAQKTSPRRRWPLIVILGVTLLMVSILLFARVSQTDIELDLALSETRFALPAQQIFSDMLQLSALGVSGPQKVQFPGYHDHADKMLHSSEQGAQAIRLTVSTEQERKGTITLAAIILPAGTSVRLRTTDVPDQFRLSFKCPNLVIRAYVSGPVRVGRFDAPPKQIDFSRPSSILFQLGPNEVDIDMTFTEAADGILSRQLFSENISFARIEQFLVNGSMVARRASTLLSGHLYLESLNGRKRPLRQGEILRFSRSEGQIRTLRLHDNHIALRFHGSVEGMTNGLGKSRRSQMPSYLEYLQARHGLSLLWATTLYLFGLFISALKWWGLKI
jgi:hypothetical protein